jgi:nucleoside-diphosphate-sugar epimerase
VIGDSALRVAVVGASSQIGNALLPQLAAHGITAIRIGRDAATENNEITHRFDEDHGSFDPPLQSADAVISLAPLPIIGSVLRMAETLKARRVIAFGSTGRFSKVGSTSALERDFVIQQQQAEALFSSRSEAIGVAWTLFRPTMIYGADADLSVAFIRTVIRKFGFFPLPLGAKGLRQPVHVADLAVACIAALNAEASFNRAYDLGGGETLPYPEMVRRIFRAEGRRVLMPRVPLGLYHWVLDVLARRPAYAFVRHEMIDRMYVDLIVDNAAAMRDFGYAPGAFRPGKLPAAALG